MRLLTGITAFKDFADIEIDIDCEVHGRICGEVFSKLGVPPKCPKCLMASVSKREAEIDFNDAVRLSGIPKKLQGATVNGFKVSTKQESVTRANVIRYLKNFDSSRRFGFLMTGNCGTGKSHLLCAIGKAVITKGFRFKYLTTESFSAMISATWSNPVLSEDEVIRGLAAYDLLALDDVGSAKISDHLLGKLNELIDLRSGADRGTILASNLSPDDLQVFIGKRIYSRTCSHVLIFDGVDKRLDFNPFADVA